MHGYMFAVVAAAALVVVIGIARLAAWVIDRREEQGTKAIRDAAFVAQARAEISDRDDSVAILDQEWMGEGWS